MFKFTVSGEKPLIIPIFIPHLGCQERCAFCNQREITGARQPLPEEVDRTVAEYLSWSKPRKRCEISFYGGSFTALPFDLMRSYAGRAFKFVENSVADALRCSTRPDAIDEKIVSELIRYRFETVELGVQSMSDGLLLKMARGHGTDEVVKSLDLLRKNSIKVGLQFMTGFPGESEEDAALTVGSLGKLKPDFIRIYPFVPLAGTRIFWDLETGVVKMSSVSDILERTTTLFSEAMRLQIPVIRIGLPQAEGIPEIYPKNLFQVVVKLAVERLAARGEFDFELPKAWETSFNMAKRAFPQIRAHFYDS